MERILQTFKEYDMEVLLAKKDLVSTELKKNKTLQDELEKMKIRIEKEIEILRNTNYDSDWTHDHRIKSPALYQTELTGFKEIIVK